MSRNRPHNTSSNDGNRRPILDRLIYRVKVELIDTTGEDWSTDMTDRTGARSRKRTLLRRYASDKTLLFPQGH